MASRTSEGGNMSSLFIQGDWLVSRGGSSASRGQLGPLPFLEATDTTAFNAAQVVSSTSAIPGVIGLPLKEGFQVVRRSQDDNSPMKKKSRRMDSVALSLVSSDGSVVNSLHMAEGLDMLETRSVVVSNLKCPKVKVPRAVQEEIRQINDRLIDTDVAVSYEGSEKAAAQGKEGVVVTCAYKCVAVSPNVTQNKMVALPHVWLLVPPSYPQSSPAFWSDYMVPNASFPTTSAARDVFVREVRSLTAPISMTTIAACWDRCARNALADASTYHGGGTLSTNIGVWESYVVTA